MPPYMCDITVLIICTNPWFTYVLYDFMHIFVSIMPSFNGQVLQCQSMGGNFTKRNSLGSETLTMPWFCISMTNNQCKMGNRCILESRSWLPGNLSLPHVSATFSTSAAAPPLLTTTWASSTLCLHTSLTTIAAFLRTCGSISLRAKKIFGNTSAATTT